MTTNEITDLIIGSLVNRQFSIFLPTFSGRGLWEADVFGINKNGYMYEYEIKRSKADFLSDFRNKEDKHGKLKERKAIHIYDEWKNGKRTGNTYEVITIPNRYFFVCKEGLLSREDIPEYAGLITIDCVNHLREVKPAPLLHKNKANTLIYERVASVLSQRIIFGCSYYTYKHNQQRKANELSQGTV